MLTISKPLSAGQALRYHAEEFQNARENYYTEGDQIRGVWYGQLANRWARIGEVREDQFQRLANGQHPITGEPLVRHQIARETRNPRRDRDDDGASRGLGCHVLRSQFRLDLPVLYVRAGLDRPSVNESISKLAALAVAQNAPLTLLNYAGGHHAFEIADDNDATRQVINDTLEFIKRATSSLISQRSAHRSRKEARLHQD